MREVSMEVEEEGGKDGGGEGRRRRGKGEGEGTGIQINQKESLLLSSPTCIFLFLPSFPPLLLNHQTLMEDGGYIALV